MTDQPTDTDPRPRLDAHSAAALALNDALDQQLLDQPDAAAALAINPAPLVDAVLGVVGDLPRVPDWIPGEQRRIGGATPPGAEHPEPEFSVEPTPDRDDTVRLAVTWSTIGTGDDGTATHTDVTTHTDVPAADAHQWALTVLSAVHAARADDDDHHR